MRCQPWVMGTVFVKVFAVNGSPTARNDSITGLVLTRLLEGMRAAGAETHVAHLSEKRVLPCDCGHRFACWVETPGRCIHEDEDDVCQMLQSLVEADLVVFATPLYVESMTWLMKMFLDRTPPLLQPYIELADGKSRHVSRMLPDGKEFVTVSVCGHYELNHFDALVATFERVAKNLHGECVATILRPHGMVLRNPDRLGDGYATVMRALYDAGDQLVHNGRVDESTSKRIATPLTTRDAFISEANARWSQWIDGRRFD